MAKLKINGEISGEGLRTLIDTIYPVGISLEFKLDVNPNTAWPWQTWEEWGQGQVIVGAGTYTEGTTTKTYSLGDSGGSKDASVIEHEHTFSGSTSSNGKHTHSSRGFNTKWKATSGSSTAGNLSDAWGDTSEAGEHSHTISGTTASTGTNKTDKNMQPYVVGKRWTRIA